MSAQRSVTVTMTGDLDRRGQTRQQILDATRSLLAQGESFARLTIPKIVATAGVSRATFYLHFQSKRELIAALGQKETADWVEIAAPFLHDRNAGRDVLEQAITQLLVLWRQHRAVLAGIIELAEYDDETRFGWRDTIHSIAQVIAQAMRERRPELCAEQAEQLGRLVVWAGERYLHQETRESSPEQDRWLIDSITDMIWRVMQP